MKKSVLKKKVSEALHPTHLREISFNKYTGADGTEFCDFYIVYGEKSLSKMVQLDFINGDFYAIKGEATTFIMDDLIVVLEMVLVQEGMDSQ